MLVTALERGNVDVMNSWLEAHPGDAVPLQELFDLEAERSSVKRTFVRSMQFVDL